MCYHVLSNAIDLQLECAKVLNETLLVPVLMHGSETIIWNQKEMSRMKVVLMDNRKDLLNITRMDRVPNAEIRKLCGLMKAFSGG